mmetsp:Transcript_26508/g.85751  ORF Transcript_26508/g.85751 Transcript_26508/m.85751 type:complete len:203 (+) Transcript_26508:2378-2986(+)
MRRRSRPFQQGGVQTSREDIPVGVDPALVAGVEDVGGVVVDEKGKGSGFFGNHRNLRRRQGGVGFMERQQFVDEVGVGAGGPAYALLVKNVHQASAAFQKSKNFRVVVVLHFRPRDTLRDELLLGLGQDVGDEALLQTFVCQIYQHLRQTVRPALVREAVVRRGVELEAEQIKHPHDHCAAASSRRLLLVLPSRVGRGCLVA